MPQLMVTKSFCRDWCRVRCDRRKQAPIFWEALQRPLRHYTQGWNHRGEVAS